MRFKTTKSPNEIGVEGQDLVVKFCFAKKTGEDLYENMTYWSECRDFMGDAVYAMYDKEAKSIYGFKYCPQSKPLETTYSCVGIRFPSKEIRDTFMNQLIQLQDFLFKYNLPNVIGYTKFPKSPNTLVLEFNKFWQQTTFNISLITFLLKSICWKLDKTKDLLDAIEATTTHDNPTKEARYLQDKVKNRLKKLLPNLLDLTNKHESPCGYAVKQAIYNIHNRSGFNHNCRWVPNNTIIGNWIKQNENY